MIERVLVQYKAESGSWMDATTITGNIAFFDTREATDEYVDRQGIDDEFIRVVPLTGGV